MRYVLGLQMFVVGWQAMTYCRDFYLVGTGTSVRPPRVVAWARRTNATKGLLRKSTSPTKTLEASASLGIFFMNLFFNYRKKGERSPALSCRHGRICVIPTCYRLCSEVFIFHFTCLIVLFLHFVAIFNFLYVLLSRSHSLN